MDSGGWKISLTFQLGELERDPRQDMKNSGSHRKCQRAAEPSFSLSTFFLIYKLIELKIQKPSPISFHTVSWEAYMDYLPMAGATM